MFDDFEDMLNTCDENITVFGLILLNLIYS